MTESAKSGFPDLSRRRTDNKKPLMKSPLPPKPSEIKGRTFSVERFGVHTRVNDSQWLGVDNIKTELEARTQYDETVKHNQSGSLRVGQISVSSEKPAKVEVRLVKVVKEYEVLEVTDL